MVASIAHQALELNDQWISVKVENNKLVIMYDENDVKNNCSKWNQIPTNGPFLDMWYRLMINKVNTNCHYFFLPF